ncbi:hypothetical protein MPNT_160066 [Candidatus Methylacidithermus pantelleriae]|uniref:Uncharacterized protein n=2 Tax=Candidatus Methylacidithermus pantelleriae TaxID=2744239 RepID=A0A8J2BNR8_9BACT|nr:hypothetical protein MPNT_160066 [Candidatus Methylacidithermus pantelleriae]
MVSYVDLVCFTVRMHETPRTTTLRGIENLFRSGAREVVLLANGFRPLDLDRYTGYSGAYYYGYRGYRRNTTTVEQFPKAGTPGKDGIHDGIVRTAKTFSWGELGRYLEACYRSLLGRK